MVYPHSKQFPDPDGFSSFQEWLAALTKRPGGISQVSIAKALGISKTAVNSWFKPGRGVSDAQLIGLSEFVGVETEALHSLMIRPKVQARQAQNVESVSSMPVRLRNDVPLFEWAATRDMDATFDPKMLAPVGRVPVPAEEHSPRTFALRVLGISMENPAARLSVSEGDIIYIDPSRPSYNGCCVLARLAPGDEALFRQYLIERPRRFLRALNPRFPDPLIELREEAVVIGVVIGAFRSLV